MMHTKKVLTNTSESTATTPTVSKHSHKLIYFLVFLILAGAVTAYYLYDWQHHKVAYVSTQLAGTQKQYAALQKTTKSLESKIAAEQKTAATTTTQTSTSNPTANYQDSDFVAIFPDSGYLSGGTGPITFSWTPQKYATYYVLEIKYSGQTDYPTPSADQYVRFDSTQDQPSTISLAYTLDPTTFTNYVWSITAYGVVNGQDVALQSTPDANLSVDPNS